MTPEELSECCIHGDAACRGLSPCKACREVRVEIMNVALRASGLAVKGKDGREMLTVVGEKFMTSYIEAFAAADQALEHAREHLRREHVEERMRRNEEIERAAAEKEAQAFANVPEAPASVSASATPAPASKTSKKDKPVAKEVAETAGKRDKGSAPETSEEAVRHAREHLGTCDPEDHANVKKEPQKQENGSLKTSGPELAALTPNDSNQPNQPVRS